MACSPWFGQSRPKWLGPLQFDAYPAHLEGSAPADYGFDPLQLSAASHDFDRCLTAAYLCAARSALILSWDCLVTFGTLDMQRVSPAMVL